MVKKEVIETTPTPTPTESEAEEVEEVDKVEYEKSTKNTLDIEDLKRSVLSLVNGAIANREDKPRKKYTKKVTEKVKDALSVARERRKKNAEEQQETKARQLLEKKGYVLSKYEETKKEEPVKKPVNNNVTIVEKSISKVPIKSSASVISSNTKVAPTVTSIKKPTNPFFEL